MPTTPAFVYFRNALATVTYHANGYVCLSWSAIAIEEADLRALYAHTLHALVHYKTGKLLTDQRLRQPLPESAQQWIVQKWIPEAVQNAHYSHCAIVESNAPGGSAAARSVGSSLPNPQAFQFRYFDDPAVASEWLTSH